MRKTVFWDWLVMGAMAVLAATLVAAPSNADSDVLQNPSNDHWYQRFDATATWNQANDLCVSKGGYLATVTSQPENDFVYGSVAAPGAPQWSWLGATDNVAEGTWKWVTGEPFAYTNWAGGEPNNCNSRTS